jgi:hypothetical protein
MAVVAVSSGIRAVLGSGQCCVHCVLHIPAYVVVCVLHVQDAEGDGAIVPAAKAPGATMSFSKATFAAEGSDQALDLNDPSFWEKVCLRV